jgi:hypothetical protein
MHTVCFVLNLAKNTFYRNIRGPINTWPKQLQENELLCRMSLIGLELIPTFVSALNSSIIFLYF